MAFKLEPKENKETKLCQHVDINALHIEKHLIMEEVGPVALMEEGHHNCKLYGVACLLRQRGPCFGELGRGQHIYGG